jgi:hypothetical protein
MSRLGNPAPQPPQPRSGAARFAMPQSESASMSENRSAEALQGQSVEAVKRQKQPMTVRLTFEAIDRLTEIERDLRRSGVRARQASASEIIEALIHSATAGSVLELIRSVGEDIAER